MPEITLPGLPAMVQAARRGVRALLEETGGCARADDVELIASEFASNAVLHSRSAGADGSFTVRLEVKPGWVRLEVADAGAAEGRAHVRVDDDEHKRGLLIVDAVADRWGHRRPSEGRAVFWAELGWEES